MADEETRLVQIAVPVKLKERILAQGKIDRREYKPEILTLLEEACDAREKASP